MTELSNEQIGENVAALRELAGKSMDDLADDMRRRGHKWTRITVFNIEHGNRQLKFQEAVDMIDALNIERDYGIKQLLAENGEQILVRKEVRGLYAALDDLRGAIFSLQEHRRHLEAYMEVSDSPDPASDALYAELREACKKQNVAELIQMTGPENIFAVVQDLYSIPFYYAHPNHPEYKEKPENIEIAREGKAPNARLAVMNKDSGKVYRAARREADDER